MSPKAAAFKNLIVEYMRLRNRMKFASQRSRYSPESFGNPQTAESLVVFALFFISYVEYCLSFNAIMSLTMKVGP